MDYRDIDYRYFDYRDIDCRDIDHKCVLVDYRCLEGMHFRDYFKLKTMTNTWFALNFRDVEFLAIL